MITLRNYQEQALEAEARHRAEHPDETRLAIVLPTGSGKTITFAFRAVRFLSEMRDRSAVVPIGVGIRNMRGRRLTDQRVLILTHTDELTGQAEAKVRLVAADAWTVGVVKADRDEAEADIVIASTQTLLNPERRARIKGVGLVIVDECELYAAPEWRAVLAHYGCFSREMIAFGNADRLQEVAHYLETLPPPIPLLGFTATLERGDGQGLGTLWQNVAFTRDISWGVRKGYLVQPIGYRVEIPEIEHMSATLEGADAQLADSIAPERIVDEWLRLGEGRPTVAFMPLVRSAQALAGAFRAAGISAEVIHGAMPDHDRRAYLGAYEARALQVLVNAMVLTRGWDSPRTKCIIQGRPTKSRSLGIQIVGRGLRPVPGVPVEDQNCIVLYVTDATTDLFCQADLSDRPIDRMAQGALTVMEDAWDIGKGLEDEARHWTGKVDSSQFDPLVRRSAKVWKRTRGGTPFLPIGKDGRYVFVVGTSVFVREPLVRGGRWVTRSLHWNLPDLELALQVAEDEATDRGGDVGALLADRDRPWRKGVPSEEMRAYASRIGLEAEVGRIMRERAGGKAGKLSDLISMVEATRAIDPLVIKIKEKVGAP